MRFDLPSDGEPVRTTCPYCGVGCGVLATRQTDGTVTISGDPAHPANFGRLCSKGSALGETLSLDGRITAPRINGKMVSWDRALDEIAARFRDTINTHGPDSVAIYGSGQLLTEDYYVANKLMKGFVGTANMDTNSRLCMASSVAGHKRAFGSDTVPGCYEDLELADLIVLVGSNLAWCHPVLYQRIVAAKEKRPDMRIVLIDPRRTMSADLADLHLPIAPDGDVALFAGLLDFLVDVDALDTDFIAASTSGFGALRDKDDRRDVASVARSTELAAADVRAFYEWFAATEKVVTVYSQGVNQSTCGTDKVNAIINCHLATGRIGRPGMGPFSVTGQPNAMGGREVGGLANMLAAHMDFTSKADIDRVARFWGAPRMATRPGLKAVDMFGAIARGDIKLVWILSTNPVVSLPDADRAKQALLSCPNVIVSDIVEASDTVACADIVLPALGWGEKAGTVTNSERRVSRQRAFMSGPDQARPDWWILCEVAKRLGFGAAFSYQTPADIFREHAALSAFENQGTRAFCLAGEAAISVADYADFEPRQWPTDGRPSTRRFGDGVFDTDDGRARFVPVAPNPRPTPMTGLLTLNTGRVRDHWHTMTRTGKAARLSQHIAEPFAEFHPADAARLGIETADLVDLSNTHGRIIVRAQVTDRQKPGNVFVPMHWTDQFAARARVDALVGPDVDPVSGQPALKMALTAAQKFSAESHGFAVSTQKPQNLDLVDYWALARTENGYRIELAWRREPSDWHNVIADLFGATNDQPLAEYHDVKAGKHRFTTVGGAAPRFALFVDRQPVPVARQWAVAELITQQADKLLAGRPGADMPDQGAIVCSCFSVGVNAIIRAVESGTCTSVDAIGQHLKAGTNCGSCRAELRGLIHAHARQAAE